MPNLVFTKTNVTLEIKFTLLVIGTTSVYPLTPTLISGHSMGWGFL